MQWFQRKSQLMDLKARVDVNCGRRDGLTENRTHMPHTAKADATMRTAFALQNLYIFFQQKLKKYLCLLDINF